MNENRNILEHLETLVGFPMSLLIYIERIVEVDIFHCVSQFSSLSEEEIKALEALALPSSVTKGFCAALLSQKRGGEYREFLMNDLEDINPSEDGDDVLDGDSDMVVSIAGMQLPDLFFKAKLMPGIEESSSNIDSYYKYKDGTALCVGKYCEVKSLSSLAVMDAFKERILNIQTMSVESVSSLYAQVSIAVNKLEDSNDERATEFADIAEKLITVIELKSNIPFKEEE